MEFAIVGVITGLAVVVALYLFFAFRSAVEEVNFQKSLVNSFENLANSHWESGAREHRRAEALEVSLHNASSELSTAETAIDFLKEKVVDLVDEVGDLEEDLEEAEEELDDMKESADEALAGCAQADELLETTLDWGMRVMNLLDRAEREGRL